MSRKEYSHGLLSALKVNALSVFRLVRLIVEEKMAAMLPLIFFLVLFSVVLYFANLISPLAPFIYSLI